MIGGNISAQVQKRSGTTKNEIGESVQQWQTMHTLNGWLDFSSGDSKYSSYNAKIQESTHIFVCDFVQLDETITAENSRIIVNGKKFDVMLIDDPMERHDQLEIYLKFTGGVVNA